MPRNSAARFVGNRSAERDETALRSSDGRVTPNSNMKIAARVPRGNGTAIVMDVQHGANSPFKTRRTRHRRRGKPDVPALVQRARQLDEMRGVIGAFDAAAHHLVVAGVLAFEPSRRHATQSSGLNQ